MKVITFSSRPQTACFHVVNGKRTAVVNRKLRKYADESSCHAGHIMRFCRRLPSSVLLRKVPITGMRLPGLSSPLPVLSLYADDTSAVLCRFEQGTGAKLNLGKCEGVWLGSWRGRLDAPVPIKWTTAIIKVLGVYLGNGNLEEENGRP